MISIIKVLKLILSPKSILALIGVILLGGVEDGIAQIRKILLMNMVENFENFSKVSMFLGLFAISSISILVINHLGYKRFTRIALNTQVLARKKVFSKILSLDTDQFYKYNTGQLTTIIEDNGRLYPILRIIRNICDYIIGAIVAIICIGTINVTMAFAASVFFITIIIVYSHFYKRGHSEYDNADKSRKKLIGTSTNAIKGFRTVKAFHANDYIENKFKNESEEWKHSVFKARIASNMTETVLWSLTLIFSMIVLIYGYYTNMTAPEILTLYAYTETLVSYAVALICNTDEIQESVISCTRFLEILTLEPSIEDGTIDIQKFNNSIELKNIKFGYRSESPVLENFNLSIKKGQKIGICGNSGSGKTTLVSLLTRFYDPLVGSIKIDGVNLKDMTFQSMRKLIGVVQQDPYLFEGSVIDNIRYGNPSALESEIVDAAKKANIHDFITTLPNGYLTDVGDNGVKLSGGQKQRIALARVFLQNPQIVIFDEATSALDNVSEKIVQESIDMLGNDKTVITIAHRLGTIANSDKIIVLNDGEIVEAGSPKELIERGGEYYKLLHAKE